MRFGLRRVALLYFQYGESLTVPKRVSLQSVPVVLFLVCIYTFAWYLTLRLGVPSVNKVVDCPVVVDQFGRKYSVSKDVRFGRPVAAFPFVVSVSKFKETRYDAAGFVIAPGTEIGRDWYFWFGRTWPSQRRIFVQN